MTTRKVVLREKAERDVDDAINFCIAEGGSDVALRFVDELERALQHIAAHPDSGSGRYSTELDIPQLHHWPMRRFPYLIFYVFGVETVDVWRVLHAKRDIPQSMHNDVVEK